MKTLNVTIPDYDGPDFPEAVHYAEFVAQRLNAMFPDAAIDVSHGGFRTQVYADTAEDAEEAETVRALVKVDLWDEFCTDGYKQFTVSP